MRTLTAINVAVISLACGCSSATSVNAPEEPASSPSPSAPAPATAEGSDDAPPVVAPVGTMTGPGSARLYTEAHRILTAAKRSTYEHVTYVDESSGTFDFDCSGFVDYALARAVPEAFTALTAATVKRPLAESYVTFFGKLPSSSKAWAAVSRASDLAAGDIVAWLEPKDVMSTDTGHVMVVSGAVTTRTGEVDVPIIDSSEMGHGADDARTVSKATGIGAGTMVLLVDSHGAPTGYRWSMETASKTHLTTVALAHLR
jgi:hypothetical protein